MSARRSTEPERSCSGAMYPSLPLTCPLTVVCSRPAALATPKSTRRATPSLPTSTFWGETSRWTIPSGRPRSSVASWAACSPCRIPHPMAEADRQRQRQPVVEGPAQQLRQRHARDVVHHQQQLPVGLDHVADRDDVWVAHARRQPGLVEEHGDELALLGQVGVQLLDGDRPPEPRRPHQPPQVHAGHAARGQPRGQKVTTHALGSLLLEGQRGGGRHDGRILLQWRAPPSLTLFHRRGRP